MVDLGADLLYSDEFIGPMKIAMKSRRVVADFFEYAAVKEKMDAVLDVYEQEKTKKEAERK